MVHGKGLYIQPFIQAIMQKFLFAPQQAIKHPNNFQIVIIDEVNKR